MSKPINTSDCTPGVVTRSQKGKSLLLKTPAKQKSCESSKAVSTPIVLLDNIDKAKPEMTEETAHTSHSVDLTSESTSGHSGAATGSSLTSVSEITTPTPGVVIKMPHSTTAHEPRPFFGKDNEDANDWLAYFTKYVVFKHMNDQTTVAYFSLLLRDRAGIWFDSLDEDVRSSWTTLKQAFVEHFASQDITRIRDAGLLWSRAQGTNELVSDYVAAMQKLARNLPITPAMLQYAILNGFKSQIKGQVMLQSCNTVDDMLHAAQKAELAFSTVVTGDPILASIMDKFQLQADAYNKGLQDLQSEMKLLAAVQPQAEKQPNRPNWRNEEQFQGQRQDFSKSRANASHEMNRRPPQLHGQIFGQKTRWQNYTPRAHRQQQAQLSNRSSDPPCSRCGRFHTHQCPAQGQQCNNCGKYNHFARVCRNQFARQQQH